METAVDGGCQNSTVSIVIFYGVWMPRFPLCACLLPLLARALDNGVARTPPMGWSSWNAYHSGQMELNEATIQRQAEIMVESGMHAAGYEYINIDDFWSKGRAADGTLLASDAFPSGMKALAAYIHSKGDLACARPPQPVICCLASAGLKFGLYTDVGTKTCGGAPGSYGHECQDAATFASWGVDWVKEDHCNLPTTNVTVDTFYRNALTKMSRCLNSTGRPIFFDLCAHGCYDVVHGVDQVVPLLPPLVDPLTPNPM